MKHLKFYLVFVCMLNYRLIATQAPHSPTSSIISTAVETVELRDLAGEIRQILHGQDCSRIKSTTQKVIMLGRTRSCKSTLINYLTDRPLEVVEQDGELLLQLQEGLMGYVLVIVYLRHEYRNAWILME